MTFRRVTTTGRELPTNVNALIGCFFNTCRNIPKYLSNGADLYVRDSIWNMDETSIYLDCPARYTYAKQGSKRVKIDTHGGEMTRMSAAFTAAADGTKLPIFVRFFIVFFTINVKN